MLEMLLLRPRAKKEVWLSRRVVIVVCKGIKGRWAEHVSWSFLKGYWEGVRLEVRDVHRQRNCIRKSR